MKRVWKRLILSGVAVAILLGLTAWVTLNFVVTRPAVYQPSQAIGPIELRSWPDHDSIYQSTQFPYVLTIKNRTGLLEYVGAKHTSDAAEPQLTEIESRWAAVKPTVALCEGRARMYRYASRNRTGKLSESELTRILANQSGIPLYTLEPTYQSEVQGLLEHFEPKLVATYMTIRVYCSEADRTLEKRQDGLALGLLRKRTDVAGLRGTLSSVEELDEYWNQTFPDEPDWWTLSNTESTPRLKAVGDRSRQIRGEHMVQSLVELVNRGHRVFAVVGASHVIRQEPVLRKLLEQPAIPDAN